MLAGVALVKWYGALLVRQDELDASRSRPVLMAWPWTCGAGLFVVLRAWAAKDVRDDAGYLFLFLAAGMACVGAGQAVAWGLGVSLRDDVMERRNDAAAWVLGGAITGAMACFAGANIGEGPTIWTTFGPAALGLGTWAAVWLGFELVTGASTAVTVERDGASGLRLGAMLVANGLILGRAMAGDFVTTEATLREFVQSGWPVLVVGAVAAVLQWFWGPTRHEPRKNVMTAGALGAGILVALAAAWLAVLGRW